MLCVPLKTNAKQDTTIAPNLKIVLTDLTVFSAAVKMVIRGTIGNMLVPSLFEFVGALSGGNIL